MDHRCIWTLQRRHSEVELGEVRLICRTGDRVVVGRQGHLTIGVDPHDERVSRQAVLISAEVGRWEVTSSNRNGIELYLWGQRPRPLKLHQPESVRWPRVALHIRGRSDLEHWIILEDPTIPIVLDVQGSKAGTELEKPPRKLTAKQIIVLRATFADLLAWPPVVNRTAPTHTAVGRSLGKAASSIREVLESARKKAQHLRPPNVWENTDPEFLFALVASGYLCFDERVDRKLAAPERTRLIT